MVELLLVAVFFFFVVFLTMMMMMMMHPSTSFDLPETVEDSMLMSDGDGGVMQYMLYR